uniref:RING-type E3 ubiquitin transferase n=1 Tax=Kalanchoe fedtschenkoi TaxID=63787 RepID=A0A7N0TEU8_KALFE
MQGQKGKFDDIWPEYHHDSCGSASNNPDTDLGANWNNRLNTEGDQFPGFSSPPSQDSFFSGNTSDLRGQRTSQWGAMECSSDRNGHNQASSEICDLIWGSPHPFGAASGCSSSSQNWETENHAIKNCVSGDIGSRSYIPRGGSAIIQAPDPRYVNPSTGGSSEMNRQGIWSNLCNPDGMEMYQIPPANLYTNFGTSSDSSAALEETHSESCSFSGSCNLSCKRMELEGGSSNMLNSDVSSIWSTLPRSNSLISTSPSSSHASSSEILIRPANISQSDRRLLSGAFRNAEGQSMRRGNSRPQGFMSPPVTEASEMPRLRSIDEFPRPNSQVVSVGLTLPGAAGPHIPCIQQPQTLHHVRRGHGTAVIRLGGSPVNYSGNRNSQIPDIVNPRHSPRNSEHTSSVPLRETLRLDPTRALASSSHHPPSPGFLPLYASSFTSHHNHLPPNQQSLHGYPTWVDLEETVRSGHFPSMPPMASGSSLEIMPFPMRNHQRSHQTHSRSTCVPGQQHGNGFFRRHPLLAASEWNVRRRLAPEVRQAVTSIQMGNTTGIEEYMLVDPFSYNAIPQTYDQYRDMRLDVDNMSYEELLALGEHIGDVRTGLTDETITKLMKQSVYTLMAVQTRPADLKPCCICQEAYGEGDKLGLLDCGHEFHTACIRQWLVLKNLCPICKTTALSA